MRASKGRSGLAPKLRGRLVDLLIATLSGVIIVLAPPLKPAAPQLLLFVAVAILFLQGFVIRQRIGVLSLTLLGVQASALLLNVQQALLIGLLVALNNARHAESRTIVGSSALRPAFGAALNAWLV